MAQLIINNLPNHKIEKSFMNAKINLNWAIKLKTKCQHLSVNLFTFDSNYCPQ